MDEKMKCPKCGYEFEPMKYTGKKVHALDDGKALCKPKATKQNYFITREREQEICNDFLKIIELYKRFGYARKPK